MRVCAKQLADDLFELVDCETKKTIDLKSYIAEFGGVEPRGGKKRKERKLSNYNIHMSDCITKRKKIEPNEVHTERFKTCAMEYKNKKPSL